MSTPLERLTAIVDSHTPAKVKFKLSAGYGSKTTLLFDGVVVKESETVAPPGDTELFELMKGNLTETWIPESAKYEKTTTVESLWSNIQYRVILQYEKYSVRCAATKRKTTDFINKTKVDDKLLAGFLLQTFIKVQSSDYKNVSIKDREVLFEQFDSLRRTFGKRV